jgi:hypothetical protein
MTKGEGVRKKTYYSQHRQKVVKKLSAYRFMEKKQKTILYKVL